MTGKLIQEQVRAWHGIALSDARTEALATTVTTMGRTIAEATAILRIEESPVEFGKLLAAAARSR